MPNLGIAVRVFNQGWTTRAGTAAMIGGLLIGFGMGGPARAAVDVVCDKRFQIENGADTLELVYCGNIDLDQADAAVDRAIISVHGSS